MDRTGDTVAFCVISLATVLRILITVVFFQALYGQVQQIGGWDIHQMYVLLGTYYFIDAISWATYTRGLIKIGRMVENGSFDLMLITPVNLKAYLSYRFIDVVFSIPSIVTAILLLVYGATQSANPVHLVAYIPFLLLGFVLHFSITLMIGSINFFHILETPHYLRNTIMALGQYPATIYKGAAKILLSFIIPLAFMFTVPARAFFGDVTYTDAAVALGLALFFYFLSNYMWHKGLNNYESAQG